MEFLLNTNKKLLFSFIMTSIFYSCCSIKNYDYIECREIPNEAVKLAIADYNKQLQKRKDWSIVAVRVSITYTSTDWFYIAMIPWVDNANKFPIETLDEYMGMVPPSHIPTEYLKMNNVIYVWHNPQTVLTQDIRRVLVNYDLVSYPYENEVYSLDGTYISYIFCKLNYKKKYYRRVTASYRTPLPSCGCH